MTPALQKIYRDKVVPALKAEFGYKNIMQVPKLSKIVLNVGYGRRAKETAFIDNIEKTLTVISGQKPVHNLAKTSISNFKVREGMKIGVSVILRGDEMYDFIYKLINLTFPRVRDFRGISRQGFDRQGNYTIGFKENVAFPEVNVESVDLIHGMEVVINTTAKNKDEGLALLKHLGFPFKDK